MHVLSENIVGLIEISETAPESDWAAPLPRFGPMGSRRSLPPGSSRLPAQLDALRAELREQYQALRRGMNVAP